jgi:tetratricopeptide (TPR) repeat protein
MKTEGKTGKPRVIWVLTIVSTLDLFFFVLPAILQTNFRALELLTLAARAGPRLHIPADLEVRRLYIEVQDRIFFSGRNEICSGQKLVGDNAPSLNCIAFFVWRTPWSNELEMTINRLVQQNPADAESVFYLAELYHRRGEFDRAMMEYKQVLKIKPDYSRVYLALGALIEEQITETNNSEGDWWEAVHWYEKYRDFVPEDLLALYRLNEICKRLNCQEASGLQTEWDKRTRKVEIAAHLLKVVPERIDMGEDLLKYTPVMSGVSDSPAWKFSWRYQGRPVPTGAGQGNSWGGIDTLMAMGYDGALRIDGLSEKNATGYIGEFYNTLPELVPDEPYLITFFYKSDRCSDLQPSFWTQLREEGTIGLPETRGEWWQVVFIVWPQQAKKTFVALQNYGPCQVRYAGISVQELDVRSEGGSWQVGSGSGGVRLGKRVIGGVSALGWDTIWWQ